MATFKSSLMNTYFDPGLGTNAILVMCFAKLQPCQNWQDKIFTDTHAEIIRGCKCLAVGLDTERQGNI